MPLHELQILFDNQPRLWKVAIGLVAFAVTGVGLGSLAALFAYGIDTVLPVRGWRIRIARRRPAWSTDDVADLLAETEARDRRQKAAFDALMAVSDRPRVVPFAPNTLPRS